MSHWSQWADWQGLVWPVDLVFGTQNSRETFHDLYGRMNISCVITTDIDGRDLTQLKYVWGLGHAYSSMAHVRSGVELSWGGPYSSTICVGGGGPRPLFEYLVRLSDCRYRFIGSDGRGYIWSYNWRNVAWECIDDEGFWLSEGLEDEWRTVTVNQLRPSLALEAIITFLSISKIHY